MTILAQRQQLITLIDEATNAGARLSTACSEAGISHRTYRRWKADKNHLGDKCPIAVRPAPSNKLSDIERQAILDACNEPRFASLPPSQIVPTEPSRDCRRPKTLRQYPYKKQTIPNRS